MGISSISSRALRVQHAPIVQALCLELFAQKASHCAVFAFLCSNGGSINYAMLCAQTSTVRERTSQLEYAQYQPEPE